MKEFLLQNDINFNYIEITDSMFNLKTFLKYRDNNPQFEEIKNMNYGRLLSMVLFLRIEDMCKKQNMITALFGKEV